MKQRELTGRGKMQQDKIRVHLTRKKKEGGLHSHRETAQVSKARYLGTPKRETQNDIQNYYWEKNDTIGVKRLPRKKSSLTGEVTVSET